MPDVARPACAAIVALLFAAATSGCLCHNAGSLRGNHFEDDHVGYDVGLPGEGWQQRRLETSNLAWTNVDLGAALLVNSHCEGVQDAPLVGLSNELMLGLTEREVLSQELRPFNRREALETIARGKLDGVVRQRAMFVLKKDGCVYDVVYDAPPERFTAGLGAYQRVRDGLSVGPRRDRE
jgi:hypothetical protein